MHHGDFGIVLVMKGKELDNSTLINFGIGLMLSDLDDISEWRNLKCLLLAD